MVAEIQIVHAISDIHNIFLHHFFADYQFSEVDYVFELLYDSFEPHHLQVFIELDIFDDEGKPNCFVGADHEMFEHVDDFGGLV